MTYYYLKQNKYLIINSNLFGVALNSLVTYLYYNVCIPMDSNARLERILLHSV